MQVTAFELRSFAQRALMAGGLPAQRAAIVAERLVEADLMGHDTHGVAQLGPYVSELLAGKMTREGDPDIVIDNGSIQVWDGHFLPGVWLTEIALRVASARAAEYGVGIISIRRSHHIGCLQAYLPAICEKGQMAIICCSDPRVASVAPHNGMDAVFTPNPIACGIPTEGDPILIDMSTSITTNGMLSRLAGEGGFFPGPWARDANGNPTGDPRAVAGRASGTLLPTGGLDHGHKGYALALMVEAMSQALSGYGRVDKPDTWGASVFLQVIDPSRSAGYREFVRQTTHTAKAAMASRAAPGCPPVRLPGQMALESKRKAEVHGLVLRKDIAAQLRSLAEQLSIPIAPPMSEEARA